MILCVVPFSLFASSKVPLFQLYSTELGSDLKFIALKEIASAKASLYLTSYGINDPDLLVLLEKKAQSIPVTILYDKTLPPIFSSALPPKLNLIEDTKSGLMHRKIVVIDDKKVLLGSTNLTEFSLKMHKNLLLVIDHPALAQAVIKTETLVADRFAYYPMPEYKNPAFEKLAFLIDHAKEKIDLAIYTITHNTLIDKLIKASQRGVKVRIFIDPGMARGVSRAAVAKLNKHNIELFSHLEWSVFHHKCALIDHTFVAGSANWTKSAFGKNRECLIFFTQMNEKEEAQVSAFFAAVVRSSKKLQVNEPHVKRSSWRIPCFPPRLLSSFSWIPWETSLSTSPSSSRSSPIEPFGSFLEKTA